MRASRNIAQPVLVGAAGLSLVLSGCADEGTPPAAPATGTPGASPTPSAATVASCVVGDWRSTPLAAERGGAVDADLRGGAGILVTIGENGQTVIDFSRMEPVVFTARVGGADAKGQFSYAGAARGTITTDGASGAASAAPSGTWRPVGDLNWSDTRVTVTLTDPVQARLLDNAPLGQYGGNAAQRTGDVVDVDPFFDQGRYECGNDTLTITPDEAGDMTWTLRRT